MSARYELIDAEKATVTPAGALMYSVVKMCEWLEVSSSGYYEWRGRPASATVARRNRLTLLIDAAFTGSDGTYGHRRIHAQLLRWGEQASSELVRALMRELGLVACQPRPWRHSLTTADAARRLSPTSSAATSLRRHPGTRWSATSPTFRRGKAGCIWRP